VVLCSLSKYRICRDRAEKCDAPSALGTDHERLPQTVAGLHSVTFAYLTLNRAILALGAVYVTCFRALEDWL
jgi:hypothetical protein